MSFSRTGVVGSLKDQRCLFIALKIFSSSVQKRILLPVSVPGTRLAIRLHSQRRLCVSCPHVGAWAVCACTVWIALTLKAYIYTDPQTARGHVNGGKIQGFFILFFRWGFLAAAFSSMLYLGMMYSAVCVCPRGMPCFSTQAERLNCQWAERKNISFLVIQRNIKISSSVAPRSASLTSTGRNSA